MTKESTITGMLIAVEHILSEINKQLAAPIVGSSMYNARKATCSALQQIEIAQYYVLLLEAEK